MIGGLPRTPRSTRACTGVASGFERERERSSLSRHWPVGWRGAEVGGGSMPIGGVGCRGERERRERSRQDCLGGFPSLVSIRIGQGE
jgi:hypothetical protein